MIETAKGFVKPEQNDVTDKLRISISENADKADALITVLETAGSGTSANLTALTGRVGAVETGKADKATTLAGYGIMDGVTKTELSAGLAGKQPVGDYATTGALSTGLAGKANKATTLAGYGITDGATDTELAAVDAKSIATLTHSKSGTVHALTGLSGKTGLVSVKFKATAAFAAGDSFKVDGVTYTAKQANGKALAANQFVLGAVVDCLLDTAGKTVNFKGGGVDVSAATATESDVLSGKTFFAGLDSLRTGTLVKGYNKLVIIDEVIPSNTNIRTITSGFRPAYIIAIAWQPADTYLYGSGFWYDIANQEGFITVPNGGNYKQSKDHITITNTGFSIKGNGYLNSQPVKIFIFGKE